MKFRLENCPNKASHLLGHRAERLGILAELQELVKRLREESKREQRTEDA